MMNRQELEAIWTEVHPDLGFEDGTLSAAIITEAEEGGGGEPQAIVEALDTLIHDIGDFARGIHAKVAGLPIQQSPRAR